MKNKEYSKVYQEGYVYCCEHERMTEKRARS